MNNNIGSGRCRKELEQFIRELADQFLPWYESASNRNYLAWQICSLLTIIAGFASSLIAGLLGEGAFRDYGKILLIVVPALGALAATLNAQFRFEDVEDIRERGRIEIQDLIEWARGQLAKADSEEICSSIYEALREKVKNLELSQHVDSKKVFKKRAHRSTN